MVHGEVTPTRTVVVGTVAASIVMLTAACGGGSEVLKVSEAAEHAYAPASHETPAVGSVLDNLKLAESSRDAGSALEELVRQQNEYNELLADAICAAMDELADQPEETRANNNDWRDFLTGYFDKFGEAVILHYAHADGVDRVQTFLNAWDMSSVSPSYALNYARACGLR